MHSFPKHLLLFLLALLSFGWLFAAGETIYEIRVEGVRSVSPELVTSTVSLRTGDVLDPEEVSKSIKQLYKMGVFADIRIVSEPYKSGVNLVIQVVENPVLAFIEYDGLKVVKRERVEELMPLRVGSFWSDAQKQQLINKLTNEYRSKGFGNAKVTVSESTPSPGKVSLSVRVDEGKRLSISQITFLGNENLDDKKLLKQMKTKPAGLLRSGRFEQEKFDLDLENLTNYYRKNGYIDAKVSAQPPRHSGDRNLELIINVNEGDQYILGQINVSGNEHFTAETIQNLFTLKPGEAFNQESFDRQLGSLYTLYFDEGYIYTEVEPVNTKAGNQLNIELKIKEGNRARIRQIQITGNQRTKEKVIRRQLDIAPGDFYHQEAVARSRMNIYNLGFFEQDIALDYEPVNSNGDIDLLIDVMDKSSGVANGGVGYNSQDHFVGQLSVSENNLFGNNWSTSLTWEFGGSTQNFEFSFTNPNLYDTDILLGSSLYYTQKEWSSFYYEIFTRGASLRLGQYLPFVDRTRLVMGYSLYSKKYRITNLDKILENADDNSTLIELDSLDWRYTSAVSGTISRDTRDSIFFPLKGSQLTLFSEFAGGLLGGDFDYFKQIAQVNWYTEMFSKLTLRSKWRFGYIAPFGDSKDAPPDEKFYLGGTGVDGIRGYPDRSVGPDGGGSREVIFSTELGYPIGSDQIIGIGFFDAGDSYNSLRDFNFLNLKKGVGAGIRIRSPFGLIGFDYAYSIENREWEPHLQFGTTF